MSSFDGHSDAARDLGADASCAREPSLRRPSMSRLGADGWEPIEATQIGEPRDEEAPDESGIYHRSRRPSTAVYDATRREPEHLTTARSIQSIRHSAAFHSPAASISSTQRGVFVERERIRSGGATPSNGHDKGRRSTAGLEAIDRGLDGSEPLRAAPSKRERPPLVAPPRFAPGIRLRVNQPPQGRRPLEVNHGPESEGFDSPTRFGSRGLATSRGDISTEPPGFPSGGGGPSAERRVHRAFFKDDEPCPSGSAVTPQHNNQKSDHLPLAGRGIVRRSSPETHVSRVAREFSPPVSRRGDDGWSVGSRSTREERRLDPDLPVLVADGKRSRQAAISRGPSTEPPGFPSGGGGPSAERSRGSFSLHQAPSQRRELDQADAGQRPTGSGLSEAQIQERVPRHRRRKQGTNAEGLSARPAYGCHANAETYLS